jgi:hypothetical protein
MHGLRSWIEGTVVFALSAVALYLFVRVPDYVSGWSLMLPGTTDRSLSPTFFPRVALATLAAVAALNGFTALGRTRNSQQDQVPTDAIVHSPAAALGWMLMLIGYLGMMWAVGFYLSSVVLIITIGWLSGYHRSLPLVPVAVVMPAAIEIVFSRVLSMRLPTGRVLDFSLTTAFWG